MTDSSGFFRIVPISTYFLLDLTKIGCTLFWSNFARNGEGITLAVYLAKSNGSASALLLVQTNKQTLEETYF